MTGTFFRLWRRLLSGLGGNDPGRGLGLEQILGIELGYGYLDDIHFVHSESCEDIPHGCGNPEIERLDDKFHGGIDLGKV